MGTDAVQPGELMVVDTRDSVDTSATLYFLDHEHDMHRIGRLQNNTIVMVLLQPRWLALGRNYAFVLASGGEVGWVMEKKLVKP